MCTRAVVTVNLTCGRSDEQDDEICEIEKIVVRNGDEELSAEIPYSAASNIKHVVIDTSHSDEYRVDQIPINLFNVFPNLTDLTIHSTLNTFSSNDFVNAKHLITLTLIGQLEKIASESFALATELTNIHLDNNSIATIENNSFANGEKIRTLTLSNNLLTIIYRGIFAGASHLESLDLHSNQISVVEDGALDLPGLLKLSLRENRLVHLSDAVFELSPNIVRIFLQHNQLQRIGNSFVPLQEIRDIYLQQNQIQDIDLSEFAKLRNLKYLILSHSGFDWTRQFDVTEQFINSTDSLLFKLDISDNQLKNASFISKLKIFKHLALLNLSSNPFERFEISADDVHTLLPTLRQLHLWETKIKCSDLELIFDKFRAKDIIVDFNDDRCSFD